MELFIKAPFTPYMFQSANSRVFIFFLSLLIVTSVVLTFVFSKAYIQQIETQALDTLSSQIDSLALTYSQSGQLPSGARLIDDPGLFEFPLPPAGHIVTPCLEAENEYYCAIAKVPMQESWILIETPRPQTIDFLKLVFKRFAFSLFILFGLSLLLTYFATRLLLRPLKSFLKATQKIGKGDYHDLALPQQSLTEIETLSQAFSRMVEEIQMRERQIAEHSLRLAHSSRLASLGQIGASVAHEVKNPLMSVKGHARMLADQLPSEDLKSTVQLIINETDRCNLILQQMLRFSRNEVKESKAYILSDVVETVLLLMKAEAKSRSVNLSFENTTQSVVVGNPLQIQQVLMNLTLNALQASKEDSEVRITTEEREKFAIVKVRDFGVGISQNIQSQIFNPFFSTKKEGDGTGLGLSISLSTVRDQGGDLHFQSIEGEGTEFEMSLPLAST